MQSPPRNGSRQLPYLVDEDDNPFVRGWTDTRPAFVVPEPMPLVAALPAVPMASSAGDINRTGTILFPIR